MAVVPAGAPAVPENTSRPSRPNFRHRVHLRPRFLEQELDEPPPDGLLVARRVALLAPEQVLDVLQLHLLDLERQGVAVRAVRERLGLERARDAAGENGELLMTLYDCREPTVKARAVLRFRSSVRKRRKKRGSSSPRRSAEFAA